MIGGSWFAQPRRIELPPEVIAQFLPKRKGRQRKPRRTDRERVRAGRISLATLPGSVERYNIEETAAVLGCSIKQVGRYVDKELLVPCPRLGRELQFNSRDVRRLDLALRKER